MAAILSGMQVISRGYATTCISSDNACTRGFTGWKILPVIWIDTCINYKKSYNYLYNNPI